MRFRWRWWYLIVPVVLILLLVTLFNRGDSDQDRVPFGEVLAGARDGQIDEIVVAGQRLKVRYRGDDTTYVARIGRGTDVIDALQDSEVVVGGEGSDSVAVRFEEPSDAAAWATFLIYVAWATVVVIVLYFAVKRGTSSGVQEGFRSREQSQQGAPRE